FHHPPHAYVVETEGSRSRHCCPSGCPGRTSRDAHSGSWKLPNITSSGPHFGETPGKRPPSPDSENEDHRRSRRLPYARFERRYCHDRVREFFWDPAFYEKPRYTTHVDAHVDRLCMSRVQCALIDATGRTLWS